MTLHELRNTVMVALEHSIDDLDGYVVAEFLGFIKVKLFYRRRWRWLRNRAIREKVVEALNPKRPVGVGLEVI